MSGDAGRRPRAGDRTPSHRRAVALAVAGGLMLAVACGDDGRAMQAPTPEQTTTTAAAAPATSATGVDAGSATGEAAEGSGDGLTAVPLRLRSPAVEEGGEIPTEHTCRGEDTSPALEWTGVPPDTAELALVVRDIDAEGFVHWVVAGIDPATGGLAAGAVPDTAVEADNDFGRPGWSGPCPPAGAHYYDMRLYALAEPSGVTAGEPGPDAATRLEGAEFTGLAALSFTATAP